MNRMTEYIQQEKAYYKSLNRFILSFIALFLSGFVIAGTVLTEEAQAQTTDVDANHSVYLELGGNGLLYTLNYDHRFNADWSARAGIMHAGAFGVSFTNIPLMGSYLIGNDHNLEIGAGAMYMAVSVNPGEDDFMGIGEDTIAGTATIGYRYQPMDGGFLFRAGITPLFGNFGGSAWGGASVGYSF